MQTVDANGFQVRITGALRKPCGSVMGRHGDGSITQRKAADGRTVFDAWWTYTEPATGARKRAGKRGFATQTAAGKHLRGVTVTVDAGTYVKVSRVTLGAYLAEWIATVRLKPQTVIGYKDKIRLHIDPHLGHLPLAEIRGHQLNALYRKLETEGSPGGRGKLSLSTVREVHAILSSAYTAAIKEGRLGITVSPTKQASPPKARDAKAARPSYVTWTGPQVREFLAQTADDHYGMIWRFLAATGCRRGEALGLSWADVNMARGTATLRTTIGEGRKTVVDPDGTAREVRVLTTGSLKSDRPRVVSLDPETLAHLEAHQGAQTMECERLGDQWEDHGLVFCRGERWIRADALAGGALDPERISEAFQRRVQTSGLPRIRLHDLRHTWATLALQNGVHVKVVQERLGHASATITLDIYSHVTEGMDRDAANTVAALFGATDGGP